MCSAEALNRGVRTRHLNPSPCVRSNAVAVFCGQENRLKVNNPGPPGSEAIEQSAGSRLICRRARVRVPKPQALVQRSLVRIVSRVKVMSPNIDDAATKCLLEETSGVVKSAPAARSRQQHASALWK